MSTLDCKTLSHCLNYNPAYLESILLNLISNALRYAHPERNPVIELNTFEENGYLVMSVKDNGIGIDPRFFSKIFIIFQRLHNREEFEGTGSGLSIVKRHIDFLGGKIWVESKIDIGSTFYFEIPKNK